MVKFKLLMEVIEWACLIIDGIVFIYIYNVYKKGRNRSSVNEDIILKDGKLVIIVFTVVNVILVLSKVINMLLI